MATIDSKVIIDRLIKDNGYYEDEEENDIIKELGELIIKKRFGKS